MISLNLNVRNKLLILVIGAALGFICLIGSAVFMIQKYGIGGAVYDEQKRHYFALDKVITLERKMSEIRLLAVAMLPVKEKNRLHNMQKEIENEANLIDEDFAEAFRLIKALHGGKEDKTEILIPFSLAQSVWNIFIEKVTTEYIPVLLSGNVSSPHELDISQQKQVEDRFAELIDVCINAVRLHIEMSERETIQHLHRVIFIFMLASVLLGGVSIIGGLSIARSITNPLSQLLKAVNVLGGGNLSSRVALISQDEFGNLGSGFNHMAEALERTTVSRDLLAREIEERKRLERAVIQSEKMAAVGQLAGGVAHEINNPLGVILGFAQGCVKRVPPGDALEMPLKSIEREAQRCKKLVQDLLAFSRAEKITDTAFNLNEAVEEAMSLIKAEGKVKDVEVQEEYENNLPACRGNRNQIQQIVVNLSNNAIDAMATGGSLIVRTRKETKGTKTWCEIQVQDTGSGIPPEIQAKIFDPFFTTKEVGKGTGLGLSLVYEIVKKHDAEIHFETQMGKGTTFFVKFPCHEERP
ncbi:MAG: HAMP domain-containing protein [Candidatus Omnitrophica bacterium]|nr:HAMP domain-containing protein [Candidatus Omnitrophota bacterium]